MIAKIDDVCRYLRPEGGWATNGLDYEGILFLQCEPFSKAEYEAAIPLAQIALDEEVAQEEAARKQAESKLEALGLTAEDLKALGL
jgi:hypothetical protein